MISNHIACKGCFTTGSKLFLLSFQQFVEVDELLKDTQYLIMLDYASLLVVLLHCYMFITDLTAGVADRLFFSRPHLLRCFAYATPPCLDKEASLSMASWLTCIHLFCGVGMNP